MYVKQIVYLQYDQVEYYYNHKSMDRIVNIEVTRDIVSGVFLSEDIAEVNLLLRAINSEIETYAIDIVTFNVNTSSRHDEIIALRLGQCVIDHSRFTPPAEGNFRTHIDFQGPGWLTTNHITGLPFKYETPIALLKVGQRITCDVIVKRGAGKQHVKWRPVSQIRSTEVDNGHKVTFKTIGMLTPQEIFQKGYEKISEAAHRAPITLFSHQLIPANMK